MQQYIKDLKQYPRIEELVKSFARDPQFVRYYDTHYVQEMTVNSFMRNWEQLTPGYSFWSPFSRGNFELAYLLKEDQKNKPLVIENNELWM